MHDTLRSHFGRLILTLFVIASTPSLVAAENREAVVVLSAPVRLRPTSSEPLAILKPGTIVQALVQEGEWHRIIFRDQRLGERIGYVRSEQLRVHEASSDAPAAEAEIDESGKSGDSSPSAPVGTVQTKPRRWEALLAGLGAFADGYAASQGHADTALPVPTHLTKLMLFGGEGHRIYLGCLSCNEFTGDSIFNEFGPFGSAYASASIFNALSQFGSRYSRYSACNADASDPPVIVDEVGRSYGRLTVNHFHRQRTRNEQLGAFILGVCAGR